MHLTVGKLSVNVHDCLRRVIGNVRFQDSSDTHQKVRSTLEAAPRNVVMLLTVVVNMIFLLLRSMVTFTPSENNENQSQLLAASFC